MSITKRLADLLAQSLPVTPTCTTPLDRVGEAATWLGVAQVERQGLQDAHARLLLHENKYIIQINANESVRRQNFSLAHEVGHLWLHWLRTSTSNKRLKGEIMQFGQVDEEDFCDRFASEMLMPEEEFVDAMQVFPRPIEALSELAGAFDVSIEAAARRITEVAGDRCAALFWERSSHGIPTVRSLHAPLIAQVARVQAQPDLASSAASTCFDGDEALCEKLPLNLGKKLRGFFYCESAGFGRQNRFVVSLVFPWR